MPCETPSTGPAAEMSLRMQAMIPSLETGRLRLRAPRIEDFSEFAACTLGPRGAYFLEEPTRENAWYDFTQMTASWLLRGYGLWTIETKAERRIAGFVLLGFEPGDHEPELGYLLCDWAEGQGLAAEAAQAARSYGYKALKFPTLVSTIDHGNTRSCRLAERLGALRDATAEAAHGDKIRVYRHPAPEVH